MNFSSSVRIQGIHYTLPEQQVGLEQLAAEGRLVSTPETMRDFGFGDCRVSTVPATSTYYRSAVRDRAQRGRRRAERSHSPTHRRAVMLGNVSD